MVISIFRSQSKLQQIIPLTAITMQEVLDSINVSQAKQENLSRLNTMGGIQGVASKLGIAKQISELTGLSPSGVIDMRTKFGDNKFPDSPMESFLSIFLGSFQDTTLLILLCSAAVSLGVNTYQDPESGYIEGVAIFVAVFAVALITAGNDYTKEMQFRELEAATQKDEKTTVIRDGIKELISADDVVVGDIVVLNVCFDMIDYILHIIISSVQY
jgi:magnesium-transporting ATPase (P-type)